MSRSLWPATLRAIPLSDDEKSYRVEQYYDLNFTVILMEDLTQLESACRNVAEQVAKICWEHKNKLKKAFNSSSMAERGYSLEDILDFLYSKIRRMGREILDQQGLYPELPTHKDGSRWVYWAEEIEEVKPE
jgi:hypothetical protein